MKKVIIFAVNLQDNEYYAHSCKKGVMTIKSKEKIPQDIDLLKAPSIDEAWKLIGGAFR